MGGLLLSSLGEDGVVFVHSHEGADCVAVVDVQGKCWPQRLITGDDFICSQYGVRRASNWPAWHGANRRCRGMAASCACVSW